MVCGTHAVGATSQRVHRPLPRAPECRESVGERITEQRMTTTFIAVTLIVVAWINVLYFFLSLRAQTKEWHILQEWMKAQEEINKEVAEWIRKKDAGDEHSLPNAVMHPCSSETPMVFESDCCQSPTDIKPICTKCEQVCEMKMKEKEFRYERKQ